MPESRRPFVSQFTPPQLEAYLRRFRASLLQAAARGDLAEMRKMVDLMDQCRAEFAARTRSKKRVLQLGKEKAHGA